MKKYTDSRWNNTTFPIIISQRELTEEEKEKERVFNEKFKIWLEKVYGKNKEVVNRI
ncbi:MAG: hypothetical protein PWP69_1071 [Enterococcus sp.]|uniref:hypothetical protein n=1 Tax=Enterococcus sp. TaxID=35783 RepID=UPI002589ACD8|nr:hypothetical protein [Enterococcus sp.]MDK2844279.1 hypothetical protein [Enterococcus sp.]